MYLYLGSDTSIRTKSVVAVFDTDNATSGAVTRGFLAAAQRRREIVDISGELPKAFLVCAEKGENKVYLSQVAAGTLERRAERAYEE